MKSEYFIDYLRNQIDLLTDLVYDIENGNLHNSESIWCIELGRLNEYLDGDFDLEA